MWFCPKRMNELEYKVKAVVFCSLISLSDKGLTQERAKRLLTLSGPETCQVLGLDNCIMRGRRIKP